MQGNELEIYLKQYLRVEQYRDYCPNGLQVAGSDEVKKIVTGVTACQALLDAAIAAEADTVLVHHGYFWKNEPQIITGIKRKRIQTLLANNLNLFAYHLPLDGHQEIGNNAQLGKLFNFQEIQFLETPYGNGVGCKGKVLGEMLPEQLEQLITQKLNRSPHVIKVNDKPIKTIGWCTGGAQDLITMFADLNVDAYISGEISEQTFHLAHEYGIHYFACGHHATERYGVKALGEQLAKRFDVTVEFIDIDNPI
jgi:dinuclear metal center YbgI/SA1388 family protein